MMAGTESQDEGLPLGDSAARPDLLSGHRMLVTGAASGIGEAVVERCRGAGARVLGLDLRSTTGLIQCDVTNEESVLAGFERAAATFDLTDVVHVVGVFGLSEFRQQDLAGWQHILQVNLTGSFLVGREAARRLQRHGTVTFIASVGGLRGEPRRAAYNASKFGLVGLMQSMARELAPDGIRVNAVCPGAVVTPMGRLAIAREAELLGIPTDEMWEQFETRVPLGRMASPHEIADVCVFLASSLSAHVTGASIVVNGGA